MTRKMLVAVFAMVGSLAVSAIPAHAGAGGSPTPLSSFFVCQAISGSSPGTVVDIQIPLLGINLGSVKIGSASLACTFAKLFAPGTENEIAPLSDPEDPSGNVTGLDGDLKCYAISAKRTPSQGPPPSYNVEDVFGLDPVVRTSESRYLCAPAKYLLNF